MSDLFTKYREALANRRKTTIRLLSAGLSMSEADNHPDYQRALEESLKAFREWETTWDEEPREEQGND